MNLKRDARYFESSRCAGKRGVVVEIKKSNISYNTIKRNKTLAMFEDVKQPEVPAVAE